MTNTSKKRRLLRLAVKLVIIFVMICLCAAIALWLFLPRERIRNAITRELSLRINQKVTIDRVSVGFYPDIEFVAYGLRITDYVAPHDMISAQKIRIDMDLIKLLKREYVVESIVVNSPVLRLARADNGTWNVRESFRAMQSGGTISTKEASGAPPSAGGPDIGPIHIHKGAVTIHDDVSGRQLRVNGIEATIDLKSDRIQLASARISVPALDAKFSGTVSRFSKANRVLEISTAMRLRKEGSLASVGPAVLPEDAAIAELFCRAFGGIDHIALNGNFSLNPLATAGIGTKGTVQGTLRTKEALFELGDMDVRFGDSTLSLAGSCSDIWGKERAAYLEGMLGIALAEALAPAGDNLVSRLDPQGTANALIELTASMEQVALKANIDLVDAGLTVPRIMRKKPGTPAFLMVDAHHVIPDEFVVDACKLMLGEAELEAKGLMKPGTEPWAQASINVRDFPLSSLDRLPSLCFEEGTLGLAAEVWQSNPARKGINHRGEAGIMSALLVTNASNEPVRNLNATIEWDNQKATVESASFVFAGSEHRMQGEIADFRTRRIAGTLHADTLNINEIARAVAKPKAASGNSSPASAGRQPRFTLQMLVEADSIYAAGLTTGPVSTTWRTGDESHSFDPFCVEVFGGTVDGALVIDTSKEDTRWEAAFEGRDMRLEEILARFQKEGKTGAKGPLKADGKLGGVATAEIETALRSLEGDLVVAVTDGEITQYSLLKNIFLLMQFPVGMAPVPGIRELIIVNTLVDAVKTRGQSLDPSRITFTSIDGAFHFVNGVARTDDLRLESGIADLLFKGDIDLANKHLDMKIRATPLGTIGSLVQKIPIAGKQLKKAKDAALSTDFIARGPISDPEVKLAVMEKLRSNGEKQ